MNKVICCLLLLVLNSACVAGKNDDSLTINSLIKNSEKLHGKAVEVKGILNVEFENIAIYRTIKDLEKSNTENAVWLTYGQNGLYKTLIQYIKSKHLSGNKVIVKGVFDNNNKGHFSLFIGTITVTSIVNDN